MKRLLVLGSEEARRGYVRAAKQERYEVIIGCADKVLPQDDTGDRRILVGAADRQRVTRAAVYDGVSGILGLGSEEALTAAYASRRLDLPGVPYQHARLFHNKLLLRQFQETHHFRVPRYRDISLRVDIGDMTWPIYVGPADETSMISTELVYNMAQLERARNRALRRSLRGVVIAQERLAREDDDAGSAVLVMTDLVIRGGRLQPLLFSECLRREQSRDPLPYGCRYPASLSAHSRELLRGECIRFARLLQLRDAELGILAYMEPEQRPYILAVGSFLYAIRMPAFLSVLYGHDLLRDIVRMTVGDCPGEHHYRRPQEDTYMAYYAIRAHRSGILRQIRVHEDLMSYIVNWESAVRQSQQIYADAARGQELARLMLRFPDQETMEEVLANITAFIYVRIDDFDGIW